MFLKLEPYRQDKKAYHAATFSDYVLLKSRKGEPVLLPAGAKIIIGVKSFSDGNYVLHRTLTSENEDNGIYPYCFTPEEMNIPPGRYFYDISVQTLDGHLYKVVPRSNFDVLESYTEKEQ